MPPGDPSAPVTPTRLPRALLGEFLPSPQLLAGRLAASTVAIYTWDCAAYVAKADRPASRAAPRPTLPPRALPPLPPPLTGSQVRQARLAKGWSQQELARRVGKSQPWVALVEQEKRTMQPQEQAALRVLMDLEPESSS
jgi:DNA-binding XRE family transcriptional regulator